SPLVGFVPRFLPELLLLLADLVQVERLAVVEVKPALPFDLADHLVRQDGFGLGRRGATPVVHDHRRCHQEGEAEGYGSQDHHGPGAFPSEPRVWRREASTIAAPVGSPGGEWGRDARAPGAAAGRRRQAASSRPKRSSWMRWQSMHSRAQGTMSSRSKEISRPQSMHLPKRSGSG